MPRFCCGLLLTLLAACQSPPVSPGSAAAGETLITRNDFEASVGWGDTPASPALTTEVAHSGSWSEKVGPGIEYAQTYHQQVGRMVERRPRRLKMSGWFYFPDLRSHPMLVLQVVKADGGGDLVWQGLDVARYVQIPNQWTYAERIVDVPAAVGALDECRFFLWQSAPTTAAYADDLELRVAE